VLSLIAEEKTKVSDMIAPLKKYHASGEINSEVHDPDAKIKELAQTYKMKRVYYLDGISVDDWEKSGFWFNVRKSNTEPILRLNLEAKTKKIMEEKRDEVLGRIKSE
jgi:phosphomannomutase